MKTGYLQVYTGNGKGKTTAALGLALRAAGAGKKVFIAQFVKGMQYGELQSLRRFEPQIMLRQYGRDCFIRHEPEAEDIRLARQGLEEVSALILSGNWDLIVLDEACIALHYKLFTLDELMNAVDSRPEHTEILITGRYAPQALLEKADLVTEMTEIKHYYRQGIQAREGIEF